MFDEDATPVTYPLKGSPSQSLLVTAEGERETSTGPSVVTFPFPPDVRGRISPLLEELLQQLTVLHGVLRARSEDSPAFTNCSALDDESSRSSPYADSWDAEQPDHPTEKEEQRESGSSQNAAGTSSEPTAKRKDAPHTDSTVGPPKSLGSGRDSPNNVKHSGKTLVEGAAGKPRATAMPAAAEGTASTPGSYSSYEAAPLDTLKCPATSFRTELLDVSEFGKVTRLPHHPREYRRSSPSEVGNLSPENSLEGLFSGVDEVTRGEISPIVSSHNTGVGFDVKVLPAALRRSVPLFMRECVSALITLQGDMTKCVEEVQTRVDTHRRQSCAYIVSRDIASKQSKLNEAFINLNSVTDRLRTTKQLIERERRRVSAVLELSERFPRGASSEISVSTDDDAVASQSSLRESEVGQLSVIQRPHGCICQTVPSLRDSYSLACEVLHHRRWLPRLVTAFSACPEAIAQWATHLEKEANVLCFSALQAIFDENVKEKKKIFNDSRGTEKSKSRKGGK